MLIILIEAHTTLLALGQGGPSGCGWTSPVNLSETPVVHTKQPTAVGDANGRVHAFWVESPTESSGQDNREYIAYRSLDGSTWSPTSDVLLAPNGGWADVAQAVVTPDGRFLHLAWVDNEGVNLSSAEAVRAWDARAWKTERLVIGGRMGLPALAIDSQGRLHVLYVRDFRSLVYVRSTDHGSSWTEPAIVSEVPADAKAIAQPSVIVDRGGGLHAAWQVNEQRLDWTPSGIRYADSFDDGASWSNPVEFAEEAGGDPALAEDSSGVIHLLWNGRAGSDGRFHSSTPDRGATWSPMERLDGYLGGLSGRPKIVTDSAGTLQVLQGSGLKDGGGVNSTFWMGDRWSPPVSIPDVPGSDHPALAITGGNQLHAFIWTQVEPAEILYASCQTAAPVWTPAPTLAALSPEAALTPEMNPEAGRATSAPAVDQITPMAFPGQKQEGAPAPSASNALGPVLVSSVSVLAVLALAILVNSIRRR